MNSAPHHTLDPRGDLQQLAVIAAGLCQHQADRDVAVAMRRQRDGAAVDHVDEGAIAQGPDVLAGEGLVVGEDPEFDAKRFRTTENGVTLITQPMIDGLNS